jgi:hypothetical protein
MPSRSASPVAGGFSLVRHLSLAALSTVTSTCHQTLLHTESCCPVRFARLAADTSEHRLLVFWHSQPTVARWVVDAEIAAAYTTGAVVIFCCSDIGAGISCLVLRGNVI